MRLLAFYTTRVARRVSVFSRDRHCHFSYRRMRSHILDMLSFQHISSVYIRLFSFLISFIDYAPVGDTAQERHTHAVTQILKREQEENGGRTTKRRARKERERLVGYDATTRRRPDENHFRSRGFDSFSPFLISVSFSSSHSEIIAILVRREAA